MGLTIEEIGIYDAPVFDSFGRWALANGVAPQPTDLPAMVAHSSKERLPGRTPDGLSGNVEPHDLL